MRILNLERLESISMSLQPIQPVNRSGRTKWVIYNHSPGDPSGEPSPIPGELPNTGVPDGGGAKAKEDPAKQVEMLQGVLDEQLRREAGLRAQLEEAKKVKEKKLELFKEFPDDIKEEIKSLIDQENTSDPLSDNQIQDCLKQRGFPLARRTISKYRQTLKIAPSHQRKILN